jgi:hypothetical protein
MQSISPNPPNTSAPRAWSTGAKLVASALLVWHLVAILIAPLSAPPSVLAGTLREVFQPYIASLDLDHAYKFFAPDPGPSHLIGYDLELADGSRRSGTFPDRQEHWPRLLYHRHFMLTEFIGQVEPGGDQIPGQTPLPPFVLRDYERQRVYARSYAAHLLDQYDARSVTLNLKRHDLPVPEQVLAGTKLDDPRSYTTRSLGSYSRAGL